jgi:glutaminase
MLNHKAIPLATTLSALLEKSRPLSTQGKVANYIPELAKAPQDALGITVCMMDGQIISAGDCALPFTMQSISKMFTLLLALMDHGERIFDKVGMEPSGDDFNSMLKLELVEPGKPFNPLINAGAIVISSLIIGNTPDEKFSRILNLIRKLCGDDQVTHNEAVFRSESDHANRNRALAYFLKDNGILTGDVEEHLQIYFKQCSVEVTVRHLARMALTLANGGRDSQTGEVIIPSRYVRIAKTFMVTCGMYNASGKFAIEVGIPAKSGVSGGILAFVPGSMGIGVVGPALNNKGNSVAGVHLLEQLSEVFDWSIF